MSVQYYVTVQPPGFGKENPVEIIRVINDEHGVTVEYLNNAGKWEEDFELYKPIVAGDPSKVEICEAEAKAIIPKMKRAS